MNRDRCIRGLTHDWPKKPPPVYGYEEQYCARCQGRRWVTGGTHNSTPSPEEIRRIKERIMMETEN